MLVGITMVLSGPFFLYHDLLQFKAGGPPFLIYGLPIAHMIQVAFSLFFILTTVKHSDRKDIPASRVYLLRFSMFVFLGAPTLIAIANQCGTGSLTLYILGVVAIVPLYIQPIPTIILTFVLSGSAVIAAMITLRGVNASLQDIITIIILIVGASFVYVAWEVYRREVYSQKRKLTNLIMLKNVFLKASGHDLKSPLLHLTALIETLKAPDDMFMRDRLEIQKEMKHVLYQTTLIMENISAFGRGEQQVMNQQIISDMELLKTVMEFFKPDLERKGIDLQLSQDEETIVVGDVRLIRTVLNNLVHNALKYSAPGQVITIGSRVDTSQVILFVQDEGPGIEGERLKQLEQGEPMASTPGTAGELGSGIGLSVCRSILKAHKSSLHIIPGEVKGLEVYFSLPRYTGGR